MKLPRITKTRIVCAVVLVPTVFLLNVGPCLYCRKHFGLDYPPVFNVYLSVNKFMKKTPLGPAYARYFMWWADL